jgi:hypothetical protein
VQPGGALQGFEVESASRPGFATAWFSVGKWPELDQSWPEKIFTQLDFIEDQAIRDKMWLVVGPMFSERTPVSTIVANFQTGIQELVKAGRLDETSPFVVELRQALGSISTARIKAHPRGDLEQLILRAAELSLHLRTEQK